MTGATGRLGTLISDALRKRGDDVTILSRSADKGVQWDPMHGPAPTEALNGRDAVIHLASEDIAQRWNADALRRIRESREIGTRNLVEGLRAADVRPKALISSSAVGYYGNRHDEVDEDAKPGDDVLAQICIAWEREAQRAEELGMRVVKVRTGVVLDRHGGALEKMLLPFRLGVGGPVAGGKQPLPWIHVDDVVGIYLAALDDDALDRSGQRHRAHPGDEPPVLKGARPRAAPPGVRARPGVRDQGAVRRHGQARDRRPACRPPPHARARVHVQAPGPRRGAALGTARDLTTAPGAVVTSGRCRRTRAATATSHSPG